MWSIIGDIIRYYDYRKIIDINNLNLNFYILLKI